jgi:hypothetical protein
MVLDDRLKRADSQTVFKRKDLQLDRERGMVSTKQMDTISLFGKYSTWLWYRIRFAELRLRCSFSIARKKASSTLSASPASFG